MSHFLLLWISWFVLRVICYCEYLGLCCELFVIAVNILVCAVSYLLLLWISWFVLWVSWYCCEYLGLCCELFGIAVNILVCAVSYLLLLWISWFVLWVICYCCEYLGLCCELFGIAVNILVCAVSYLVLLWTFWFVLWVICCCCDSCGPPYKGVWKFFISSVFTSDSQCPQIPYFGLLTYINKQLKPWLISYNALESSWRQKWVIIMIMFILGRKIHLKPLSFH